MVPTGDHIARLAEFTKMPADVQAYEIYGALIRMESRLESVEQKVSCVTALDLKVDKLLGYERDIVSVPKMWDEIREMQSIVKIVKWGGLIVASGSIITVIGLVFDKLVPLLFK